MNTHHPLVRLHQICIRAHHRFALFECPSIYISFVFILIINHTCILCVPRAVLSSRGNSVSTSSTSSNSIFSDGREIHCGCDDRDRAHGSCCGCEIWNDAVSEICTSGGVCVCVHLGAICQTTSLPECVFRSTVFHPTIELHLQRLAYLQTLRTRNRVGSVPPKHFSTARTCRRHFRSRASTQTNLNCPRKPCTAGPTHGSAPSYPA